MSTPITQSPQADHSASGHLKALAQHEMIAAVLSYGLTQDSIVSGKLIRLPIFFDALRKSRALGRGPAFALSLEIALYLGQRVMRPLPPEEKWKKVCGEAYVMRLRKELSKLPSSFGWVQMVLSGALPTEYFKMPPLSQEDFARDLQNVWEHLESRGSMLENIASHGEVDLQERLHILSLGRPTDVEKIDHVEKLAREKIMECREDLVAALHQAILEGAPAEWHKADKWQIISLASKFKMWRRALAGEALKIAIEHGARGQIDPIKLPTLKIKTLDRPEWEGSWRLVWGDPKRGAALAGAGTVAGATAGGIAAGSPTTGAMTACAMGVKCTSAVKIFAAATAGGGLIAGGIVLGIWAFARYNKKSAAKAYAEFVASLVVEIEAAFLADFMSTFRAYYGRITYADDLQAQAALEDRLHAAMHRLSAANTYAQRPTVDEARQSFKVV